MILFILSLISVSVSSYLISSCFADRKHLSGFIYLLLTMFAQIVLTVEILSLFNAISIPGVIFTNLIFLSAVVFIWFKNGKPLWRPQIKKFFFKIINAFKKDKMLAVMGAGLIFFICISIFLCALVPIVAYDSLAYHINRALFWAANGNLLHFDIADDRNLVMAINSEILYCWFFTFVKRNMFIGFFSLAAYFLSISALWSVLEQLGYNIRKRLWSVFMMSALAGVILEASGPETNVWIGGLMLSGVCLFLLGAKKNRLPAFFFSALAFALAIGTKSTALFILPSAGIICLYILIKYQKHAFWHTALKFSGFFAINFILFASFNYILNFIHFGSIMGSQESLMYHSAVHTIKGFVSGFIRHSVLLLDFTGFSYSNAIQKYIFAAQNHLLNFLNIPLDYNVISGNENELNNKISDPFVGGGVIGVIVFLPCMIMSIIRAIFRKRDKNSVLLGLFGLSIILSIVLMSAAIGFMLFSARFIVSFIVFASPVFILSYIKSNKNILKYFILFYVMSYFIVISTHIWPRHFVNVVKQLKRGSSISKIRQLHLCSLYVGFEGEMPFCTLRSYLYKNTKPSEIGLFTSSTDNTALLKFMEKDGYTVDSLLTEKFNVYTINKYDFLIFTKEITSSSYIANKDYVMNNYSFAGPKIIFFDFNRPKCILMDKNDAPVHKGNAQNHAIMDIYCEQPVRLIEEMGFKKITVIVPPKTDNGDLKDVKMTVYKNVNRP